MIFMRLVFSLFLFHLSLLHGVDDVHVAAFTQNPVSCFGLFRRSPDVD
jgi:hypothetical protein